MAFPTIPTGGRVLSTNQADTSGTRTFPSLSSLTKNSGDLLIAIIVAYQNGGTADANFSSWGGGFTEFYDNDNGASTISVGMAWKVSTGSETGTFTVTQAATVTGHASMFLLSIPGGHNSTAPEAGGQAWGTSAAADPASFNPSGWDVEDTLWISVVGSGMTSGTGSWTGTGTTAPTNFTDRVDSNTADNSTVGQTEAAVSFRQQAAASQDVGTAGVDTSNARNTGLVIAVRPSNAVTGSGGVTIAKPGISGTGAEKMTGTAAITIAKPAIAGTAAETFTGSGGITIAKPTLAATGAETFAGSGGVTIAKPTIAGTGEQGDTGVTGSGGVTLGMSIAGTGTETMSGSAAITISKPTVSGSAAETFSGSGGIVIQKPTLAATGLVANPGTGTGAISIAKPTIAATGAEGFTGTAAVVIAKPAVAGTGFVPEPVTGTGAVVISKPAIAGVGIGGVEPKGAGPGTKRAKAQAEGYSVAEHNQRVLDIIIRAA